MRGDGYEVELWPLTYSGFNFCYSLCDSGQATCILHLSNSISRKCGDDLKTEEVVTLAARGRVSVRPTVIAQ